MPSTKIFCSFAQILNMQNCFDCQTVLGYDSMYLLYYTYVVFSFRNLIRI